MSTYRETSLTSYQKDIWAAESRAPGDPQFNVVQHERLTGPVDTDALHDALTRTLLGHEAFRIRFGERDGVPFQWSGDPGEWPGVWEPDEDLSGREDPAAAVAARLEEFLAEPFTVQDSPLVSALLVRESSATVHLALKAHHLVVDGWALNTVSGQMWEAYARGDAAEGSRPRLSHSVAVEADAAYRASADRERDLAFHRDAHRDTVPVLFPRSAGAEAPDGPGRARYGFSVDAALVDRIREGGGSPFGVVAAAFATYFARVHRSEQIVLGVPFLNRQDERTRSVVGQFANSLPLRVDLRPDASLPDLAEQVRTRTAELRGHERLALGDVLRTVGELPGGVRALFDITLSYVRFPAVAVPAGITRVASIMAPVHRQDALAVTVHADEGDGTLRIALDHALDVFDEDFPVAGVAEGIRRLLEGAVEAPERPALTLPLVGEEERAELVRAARGPDVAHRTDRTLHQLFEERAAVHPGRTAVVDEATGERIDFATLDARANQIARALRARGVGPDDRVAVLMRRGPDLPAALLGVLKAGGAYVPVDPGYPQERISFLLEDSRASVVLTSGETPPSGLDPSVPVLTVRELLRGPSGPVEPAAGPHHLAYVIYTSGSTGRPKGVMVEHRSVVNRLAWMQRRYPIGADDVLLQKTPISFDVSVWELFWWAAEGASVALLPVDGEKDPRDILRTVRSRRVTTLHFVPSMLGPFLDLLEESPALRADAASLRRVFCSGEALPPARVDQFHRVFGAYAAGSGPLLVNLYGPTEATVDVSHQDLPGDPAGAPQHRVPIGRPVDNTRLHVLDPAGAPQPAGLAGELCVGGVQVARGYLGREELTAEKFVADPFAAEGRLYRTGDLARLLSDGTLEYLGRIDGQVKIRGNRVELGEVQSALAAVDGVRDAIVVDRESADRSAYLVGYYVADLPLDDASLRADLAATLPAFMVPAHFVRIDAVPLTPNGKADRRALPEPSVTGASPRSVTAPRNDTERRLALVWAELLDVAEVGVHDNYYALGGDSIQMLRLRAAAEKQGLHFSLSDLVRNPTVAGLASVVTEGPAAPTQGGYEPFALVSRVDVARLEGTPGIEDAQPLSRLQLGLIYHSRTEETSAVYRDVFQYSLTLPWQEEAFRSAFDRLVARHPALRSSFDLGAFSEPLQLVHDTVEGGLSVRDLRGLPREAAREEIAAYVAERRYHPYVFTDAPLHHFRAYVLADDRVELVLNFHHALLDGGSVANAVSELLQDHLHLTGAGIGAVPEVGLPSAAGHVAAERASLESAESRAHWSRYLEGSALPQFDGFRPHEAPGSEELITRRIDLPGELASAVREFAREHALPVKSVLFAAHCLTLGLFTGTTDVTTGLVTHGRPDTEGAERIVGLFLNTLPVRLDTDRETLLDVARETFRQEQRSHPYRRHPLSAVQEELGVTVLDTAFNYIHFRQLSPVLALPGVRMDAFHAWEETNFSLLVNAVADPADGHLWLRMDYRGSVFTPGQAALYADRFLTVLDTLAHHPHQHPDTALRAGAPGLAPAPAGAPTAPADVVTAVREQVEKAPDSVALVFGDERWTYADLGRASDRVAHRLLALGASASDSVGIAMDRSPETVAVILGVLKAGAAALPLDTDYPQERLAAMLEQARPLRVVAQRTQSELLPEGVPVLLADDALAAPDGAGAYDGVPLPAISPASTAYVLFTSGSTGRPKGVAMPHRSLAQLIAWQNDVPSGAVGATTVQYAPLSFDVSFQEIFSTLCGGGTLLLLSGAERRDLPALLRLLDRERVERLFLPYVALQQLAETADALGLVPRALTTLISSGEQLRVTPEIRRLCAALPRVLLENQYGPTESHVVTRHTMTGDPASWPPLPPIGKAVPGSQVLVLDAELRPVPAGVKGEIHLGGVCLADGYLHQPELTAERFVPHPDGTPGRRLYRTGDLGVVLPDGSVVCLGRADAQVKVRGFRVEPAEVELAVARFGADHPGLAEVAVVARRREGNDSFLAAFLVGEREHTDLGQLGKQLRTVLPDYMLPSHYEWLPELPLTPSGKRDDASLRRIILTAGRAGDDTPPRDAYEHALAELLGELLQLPVPGVHDNIFDLGGTSLTAMRLVVLIEQRYGVTVPLSEFISAPTVAQLADRLRSGGVSTEFDPLVPIRSGGDRRPAFFVHPMGGNVLCYVRFAKYLRDDQPLYALQAAGVDAGTEPLRSVEEIAAGYIEAVRRVQPEGPYVIGGWSFGGFVAFEMARQLRDAGQEVARLVLLDTTALNPGRRLTTDDDALLGWFFWELLWLQRGGDSPLEAIPSGLGTLEEKFGFIARLAVEEGVLPAGSTGAVVRRLFHVYEANWRAAFAYRPAPVDQDMTLVHASEPLPEVLDSMHTAIESLHRDPTNGWRERTRGELTVIDVPGDHLTIMEEPHVAHLAQVVTELIGE
ncbi:amino acid adenylation domain-containing protein [Streptomyces sp. CS7]|uniref:amino acid adenylation domain-containing protein n=1 Tax=Streptomyces sp. CS-7 TaxID=2906769 RepID=UPI0021B19CF3|nr:non-ribosomal peptide synthetase [Streptomyces sp. CS-7]MCT6778052.1 amino acid adenylation domain-containing protein [Streptomyces sp. CS-7]